MLKLFKKKKKETPKIVVFASKFWTDEIERPYYYIHCAPALRIKREREVNIPENKIMVLESALASKIGTALENSAGYIRITQDGPIVQQALQEADINIDQSYFGDNITMYIEEGHKAYVYRPGMKRAERKF